MPKLSVYVPDDLWEQAKQAAPGSKSKKPKNSQIVQRALEQMLSEQQALRTALGAGAVRDEGRIAQLVTGLREQVRASYEEGYAAGLDLVEEMDLFDLQFVNSAGGLSESMEYLSMFEPGPIREWWERHGGRFDNPFDNPMANWDGGSEPFRAGAAQAIDDVWQALRANSWGTVQVARKGDDAEGAEDSDETEEE